jgi:single-stranded-DNA-specific exonuclease
VIGIVAARIAERHHRPTVLIAAPVEVISAGAGGDSTPQVAVGSGRSIAGFDLLGALAAASGELLSYGGHRAAAGLRIEVSRIDAFREAFVAHAEAVLGEEAFMRRERVDAVADGEDVGLAVAEELSRLAPFGNGNPPVTLLLAAATLSDPVAFGGEGRGDHARFTVQSGRARARAVAFATAAGRLPLGVPVDGAFSLERNEWQGVVEARLVLRAVARCAPAPVVLVGEGDGGYLERAFAELDRDLERPPRVPAPLDGPQARVIRDRRDRGVAATIVELVRGGEPVLVVCASTGERLEHLQGRLGGFALCSYAALARDRGLAARYTHLVALDPPANEADRAGLRHGGDTQFTHLAWGQAELRFAQHILEQELPLRGSLVDCYRALRDGGGAAGGELEAVLRGDRGAPRSAERAGRVLRVLVELGLVTLDRAACSASVTGSGERVSLEQSPAYRAYQRQLQDGAQSLEPGTTQAA